MTVQARDILDHFSLTPPDTPTLAFVGELLAAYVRRVPWGSVCRIARRAANDTPAKRARFVDAFWTDVLAGAGDGTCFESNYAFFALLLDLGYEGYLTINDMGETIGCHSAIVLQIDGEKWLVDVGLPVFALLHLTLDDTTRADSPWHIYHAIPADDGVTYAIMRSHHPKPVAFTLKDVPVSDADYRARLVRDHEADGLFLDKVILNMVVDDVYWRYNGRGNPRQMESFPSRANKQTHLIDGDIAEALAARFGMDEERLRAALDAEA
ncbi:MAG: arylamine N-acetyltransferase [Chloroflexota bacterium]